MYELKRKGETMDLGQYNTLIGTGVVHPLARALKLSLVLYKTLARDLGFLFFVLYIPHSAITRQIFNPHILLW